MKVLSLTQPWASLMAFGEKHIETRSWGTGYRGSLLIHASKGFPADCKALCRTEPFATALRRHGVRLIGDLPLGQIIARVELVNAVHTNHLISPGNVRAWMASAAEFEREFGDYSDGRWAWLTQNVVRLVPTLARGSLGLWDHDEPLEYLKVRP